ncbi:MAG TPA: hypothetical protein VE033_08925 [Acetobacteraceae bacterium]|nr:hypothetical protein [Acetobacteraceae bacterium]
MTWSLDARIPVTLVADDAALLAALRAGPPAGLLVEAPPPPALPAGAVALASFDPLLAAHAAACACCGGQSPAAAALDRLFQARVRGACPWYERIVALVETTDARAQVEDALRGDRLAVARFRSG